MGRRSLTPDEIEGFRDRLVAAASKLFAERGYDAVTLRAIAEELGCSPMTPYRYFRDKDAIFAAVRSHAHRRFAEAQEQAEKRADSTRERLEVLGRAYVGFGVDQSDLYRLMFEMNQPDPDRFPELRDAEERSWAPLRRGLAAAVEEGLLKGTPEELAHLFWCCAHGIVSLHLAGKLVHGYEAGELIQSMQRLILGARTDERRRSGGDADD